VSFTPTPMPSTLFARLAGTGPAYTSAALVKQALRSYVEQVSGGYARYSVEPDDAYYDVARPVAEMTVTERQVGLTLRSPEFDSASGELNPAQITAVRWDIGLAFSTISAHREVDATFFANLFRLRCNVHPALAQLSALGITVYPLGPTSSLDFENSAGMYSRRQIEMEIAYFARFVDSDTSLDYIDTVSYSDTLET